MEAFHLDGESLTIDDVIHVAEASPDDLHVAIDARARDKISQGGGVSKKPSLRETSTTGSTPDSAHSRTNSSRPTN